MLPAQDKVLHNADRKRGAKLGRLRKRVSRRLGEYVAIAAKRPSWLLMFAFSRILVVRSLYRRIHGPATKSPCAQETFFPGADVASATVALQRDGIAQGLCLPRSLVDEILAFSRTAPCFGDSNPGNVISGGQGDFAATPSEYIIADYRDGIGACPAIKRLWTDPTLVGIAGAYIGTTPHLLRSRLWWSLVDSGAGADERSDFSQAFHFDLDDWMCCKFFFYITETTERNGPHQYVRTSHRRRPLSLQLSLLKAQTEEKIRAIYGPENILTLTGRPGFGFVEDPFGIHRGTVPTTGARLILEVEYGCSAQQQVAGRYGVPHRPGAPEGHG